MSDLLQFPNERKQYALSGTNSGEPVFVSDFVIATQNVLEVLRALYNGALSSDFYIISGLEYNSGLGTYSEGIVYIENDFYAVPTSVNEGKYLKAEKLTTIPKQFEDGNTRDTYTIYTTSESNIGGSGYSPLLSGNMNNYRVNIKQLNDKINTINSEWDTFIVNNVTSATDSGYEEYVTLGSLSFFKYKKIGKTVHVQYFLDVSINNNYDYSIIKIKDLPFTGALSIQTGFVKALCRTASPSSPYYFASGIHMQNIELGTNVLYIPCYLFNPSVIYWNRAYRWASNASEWGLLATAYGIRSNVQYYLYGSMTIEIQ